MTVLIADFENDKKIQNQSTTLTGETQLRARRTRIKILRAIAERNGSAGFSEIRDATGLSTGSIYYHLERMESYVIKESKTYTITEEGKQLLHTMDVRNTISQDKMARHLHTTEISHRETLGQAAA